LQAVNSTVFQLIRSGKGLQVVLNRVGRLGSDVYLCIPEQVCDFEYQRTIEGESDQIFALRGRCDPWCMLFFKYFVS
jgi:hypothetical protein